MEGSDPVLGVGQSWHTGLGKGREDTLRVGKGKCYSARLDFCGSEGNT